VQAVQSAWRKEAKDEQFARFHQGHGNGRKPDYMPMRLNASGFQPADNPGTSPANDKRGRQGWVERLKQRQRMAKQILIDPVMRQSPKVKTERRSGNAQNRPAPGPPHGCGTARARVNDPLAVGIEEFRGPFRLPSARSLVPESPTTNTHDNENENATLPR
jgi:hypothetical protein